MKYSGHREWWKAFRQRRIPLLKRIEAVELETVREMIPELIHNNDRFFAFFKDRSRLITLRSKAQTE